MTKIKLWWIAAALLTLTFIMTNGSGIYRFISMVDMFIWFIYINIFVLVTLMAINIIITSKLSVLTSLPSFLTKNFLIETIAEDAKEKGLEKANELGMEKFGKAHKKATEMLEKFSFFGFLKDLFIYSGAAVAAHTLVNKYFVPDFNFAMNTELMLLMAGNAFFIFYYFYNKVELKPARADKQ